MGGAGRALPDPTARGEDTGGLWSRRRYIIPTRSSRAGRGSRASNRRQRGTAFAAARIMVELVTDASKRVRTGLRENHRNGYRDRKGAGSSIG